MTSQFKVVGPVSTTMNWEYSYDKISNCYNFWRSFDNQPKFQYCVWKYTLLISGEHQNSVSSKEYDIRLISWSCGLISVT